MQFINSGADFDFDFAGRWWQAVSFRGHKVEHPLSFLMSALCKVTNRGYIKVSVVRGYQLEAASTPQMGSCGGADWSGGGLTARINTKRGKNRRIDCCHSWQFYGLIDCWHIVLLTLRWLIRLCIVQKPPRLWLVCHQHRRTPSYVTFLLIPLFFS